MLSIGNGPRKRTCQYIYIIASWKKKTPEFGKC